MDTSEVIDAFLSGYGQWKGCSWRTVFGNRKLNLQGLKPSQAALIGRSTAGQERADWMAAAGWLDQVERDARQAETEAEIAADLAIFGQWGVALEHVDEAVHLEARYKASGFVWQRLRSAILHGGSAQVTEDAGATTGIGHARSTIAAIG